MFDSHNLAGTSFDRFVYCSKTSTCRSSRSVAPSYLTGEEKAYSPTPPASGSDQRADRPPLLLLLDPGLSLWFKRSLFPLSRQERPQQHSKNALVDSSIRSQLVQTVRNNNNAYSTAHDGEEDLQKPHTFRG